jgi:predicted TPR repeat methyltransferase
MERSESAGQPAPLDDALAAAIRLQMQGQLEEAEQAYGRLRETAPEHAGVLHFAGVLSHQLGRTDEALELIRRSLGLDPGQAGWHSNLGLVLKTRGQVEEAVAAFREAIRLDPDHANAHANLGVLLRAQGRAEESEAAYRTAIRLAPDQPGAYHNLGVLLLATSRQKEAVRAFCKALTLNPAQAGTRSLLANAYYITGEREKAVALFEEWLQESPGDPVALHMLAACSGKDVPARASDEYVERTFDEFADSFDAKLGKLLYRAPELVASSLAAAGLTPGRRLAVLDAGCGTGLCGPLVAPYAARLVGVDLSARMLAQARGRGVYDELVKGELVAFLDAHPGAYDVVLSADTLVYFGALDAAARAAARALRPGGLFVFTVEEAVEPEWAGRYRINPHGRYSHHRDYVEAVMGAAGFVVALTRAELRMEAGAPVPGLVVRGVLGGK